jgi:hypothetical protein
MRTKKDYIVSGMVGSSALLVGFIMTRFRCSCKFMNNKTNISKCIFPMCKYSYYIMPLQIMSNPLYKNNL